MRSRIYGCSSELGGEIGVTGWWQQMVNATGWIVHFCKEISTEFVTSVGKRWKSGIVECRPIEHRCCDGMNDAQSSSLDCLNRLCLILRQSVVPNDRSTVFEHWSDNGDVIYRAMLSQNELYLLALVTTKVEWCFGSNNSNLCILAHLHPCISTTHNRAL